MTTARGRRVPVDQADGLRRMFGGTPPRFVAVAGHPGLAFGGVLLERLATACVELGRRVLVVDAAGLPPVAEDRALPGAAPHALAAAVQPLTESVSYLPAHGLPRRYLDAHGSSAGFLDALATAVPGADAVLLHAEAGDLSRVFAGRAVRPVLLAADTPASVTQAYASMKLLVQRNALMAYDLVLAAAPTSPRRERIAEQLAGCADSFLGAALHDWAAVDPTGYLAEPPPPALSRLMAAQLDDPDDLPLPPPAWRARSGWRDRAAMN